MTFDNFRTARPIDDATISAHIATYAPRFSAVLWYDIAPFVRNAVADAHFPTFELNRRLLTYTSQYVLWCWQSAGIPLVREQIFTPALIDYFLASPSFIMKDSERTNRRLSLLRLADLLSTTNAVAPVERIGVYPNLSAPYSNAEMTKLRSWATIQGTQRQRRNAVTLLCLAAGAGLRAGEIVAATADDITVTADGVMVTVPGAITRHVPLLSSWARTLTDLTSTCEAGEALFVSESRSTPGLRLQQFVRCSAGIEIKPTAQRLRSSWVITHLTASTPLAPFLTAADLNSPYSLRKYLPHVPQLEKRLSDNLLRSAEGRIK